MIKIIFLILLIGFVCLYYDLYKKYNNMKKPEVKTVYRYIPRQSESDLNYQEFPSDIFRTMFKEPSPWIQSLNDTDTRYKEDINKYFISQN